MLALFTPSTVCGSSKNSRSFESKRFRVSKHEKSDFKGTQKIHVNN